MKCLRNKTVAFACSRKVDPAVTTDKKEPTVVEDTSPPEFEDVIDHDSVHYERAIA